MKTFLMLLLSMPILGINANELSTEWMADKRFTTCGEKKATVEACITAAKNTDKCQQAQDELACFSASSCCSTDGGENTNIYYSGYTLEPWGCTDVSCLSCPKCVPAAGGSPDKPPPAASTTTTATTATTAIAAVSALLLW
eukprot:gnl/TRDRNA2_/TRDRNA2_167660_c0_seq3.p1 gnl/TRDRNA2_/TRDRNA2_167660_c0~~gnl/TRDRNA2_/TRDRNA2_167660_c0_seq3.p1  ORF type:complete len:141 (-),score=18.32 gnl/TRDRNA2_/TRDRNA2_167660_c0_seq3:124-546(-)